MALIHLRNFKLQNLTLGVEQGQLPLMQMGHGHLPWMQVRKVSDLSTLLCFPATVQAALI